MSNSLLIILLIIAIIALFILIIYSFLKETSKTRGKTSLKGNIKIFKLFEFTFEAEHDDDSKK